MKINKKIFSLPPYISTTWNHIESLHMERDTLIVSLHSGESIEIPKIQPELLETIFDTHASFIESEENSSVPKKHNTQETTIQFPFINFGSEQVELPFKFGIPGIENFQAAMQHNPEQAHLDNLPDEVLSKIRSLSKVLIPKEALESAPKGEPHCNCMYCQIAKALHQGFEEEQPYPKNQESDSFIEEINEQELRFQQWDIEQTDQKMYNVINRLDKNEKYSVFLGNPVGCTCGQQGCEHILAVLKS